MCSNRRHRLLSLKDDPLFGQAVDELKREGVTGAQALAVLIDELLAARCIEILDALAAASRLSPHRELVSAIQRVVSAPPVISSQTLNTRFAPVIIGGGRIGWDDGTAIRIKEQATVTLKALGIDVANAPGEGLKPQTSRAVPARHQGPATRPRRCQTSLLLAKDARRNINSASMRPS